MTFMGQRIVYGKLVAKNVISCGLILEKLSQKVFEKGWAINIADWDLYQIIISHILLRKSCGLD